MTNKQQTVRGFSRWTALCLILALTLSLTGCFTGTIYGKPLKEISSTNLAAGVVQLEQITALLGEGNLAGLNEKGYHHGLTDAVTFEAFYEQYQALSASLGKAKSISLKEAYEYGNDFAFIGEMQLEKGSLMLSALFDSYFEIRQLFAYETPQAALSKTQMPEGVEEISVTLGEGTQYPVAAKLTVPKDREGKALPAAVLVGGDGANPMDMKAGETYLYRDLAWALAEAGIASIRYDKRNYTYQTVVDSTDVEISMYSVSWEYTEDALLAFACLSGQPFVDPERIYYIGHSQGGVVGSRVQAELTGSGAKASANVSASASVNAGGFAGFVLINTSSRPWYEVIYDQYINYGLVDQSDEALYYLVTMLQSEKKDILDKRYERMSEEELISDTWLSRPAAFWKDFLSFDYTGAYLSMEQPVLILQGEADYQVTMAADYAAWQEAAGAKANFSFKSLPGLNHLLMNSEGIFAGHYKEYDIPQRLGREAAKAVADFILLQ